MRNIMLDIETLGTKSTSVILSIGAIAFGEQEIGHGFHRRINIDSCLEAGLTVDGKTIQWWMGQSEEARALFSHDGDPLAAVLLDFKESFDWQNTLVWCNGMNFDLPILDNAFRAVGMEAPWAYYNGRDFRTVKNMFPKEFVNSVRVEPMVAHDALDDSRAQALTLQALLAARTVVQKEDAA